MQAPSSDLYASLQNFLLAMVGLSVACERVTETIKEWLCPTQSNQANAPSLKRSTVQLIAIISGMLVTAMSSLDPLGITQGANKAGAFSWTNPREYMNWLVTGILVSGGSAFWNHLLDILQATKTQKEKLAAAPPVAPAKQVAVAAPGAAQPVGAVGD